MRRIRKIKKKNRPQKNRDMGDTKVKRDEEENHKIYYTYNKGLRKTK